MSARSVTSSDAVSTAAAFGPQFCGERVQSIGATRAQKHLRAGAREFPGDPCADAARRAGDQNDLVHGIFLFSQLVCRANGRLRLATVFAIALNKLVSCSWTMDLNLLPLLFAVADEQNFRAAADRLGLTRSAVSQGVRRLEDALGQQLVMRTTRSVHLTEAGERLVTNLRGPMEAVRDALEVRDDVPRGRLRLAVTSIAEPFLSGPLLARFAENHPDSDGGRHRDGRGVRHRRPWL